MNAVSDSSPLIVLAKVGHFVTLNRVFPRVYISNQVHDEIVVAGAGLPGAAEVAAAAWIHVKNLEHLEVAAAQRHHGLGSGEMSTILLAKQISADLALLDDKRARSVALTQGLQILGSLGLLEFFYKSGFLPDIRAAFQKLLALSYIEKEMLDVRLELLGLEKL